MNIKDKNILITGASGLLGLEVCKKLSPNNNLSVLYFIKSILNFIIKFPFPILFL